MFKRSVNIIITHNNDNTRNGVNTRNGINAYRLHCLRCCGFSRQRENRKDG